MKFHTPLSDKFTERIQATEAAIQSAQNEIEALETTRNENAAERARLAAVAFRDGKPIPKTTENVNVQCESLRNVIVGLKCELEDLQRKQQVAFAEDLRNQAADIAGQVAPLVSEWETTIPRLKEIQSQLAILSRQGETLARNYARRCDDPKELKAGRIPPEIAETRLP